jgi:prepilin-type N-terminal cleavage/methylation domain-containing protein
LRQKAFTLIELLVVIAIIAILAAILFPVFAQAKIAAKATVAISNLKEASLAIIMYSNDVDDCFPLAFSDDPTGQGYWSWQGKVQPYVKNWGVLLNPMIVAPSGTSTAIYQRMEHMGTLPVKGAVVNMPAKNGVYPIDNFLSGNVNAELDGIMGFGALEWGYSSGTNPNTGFPSITTTSVGNPADNVMVTPATAWDYWMGIFGNLGSPFANCATWSPGTYDAVPSSWGFTGPVTLKPNPSYESGYASQAVGCYYPSGITALAAVDGHVKTMDYRGQLMGRTTLSSGVVVMTHYWPQGTY